MSSSDSIKAFVGLLQPKTKLDILIIEDDPNANKALPALLGTNGFTCKLVNNLAEGLEEIKQGYKFILIDLMLPDGNGLSILRALRAQNIKSKCIITTGYLPENVHEFEKYHVLTKPIDFDELLQLLKV